MPFSRSDKAYFYQRDVHQLIQHIAGQKSVVIYAGAGVSIDRTGVSWGELVTRLLEEQVPDSAVRRAVMDTYTPLEAASIVCQLHTDMYADKWMRVVVNKLRSLLYAEKSWQRGSLVATIIELAAAFVAKGVDVQIVTTNYDSFLEEEVKILNLAREAKSIPELPFEPLLVQHGNNAGALLDPEQEKLQYIRTNTILHLHGYVPESGGETPVILSEVATIESQVLSSAILGDLFRRNAVLIVGCSLTDPPLLSALARSIRTETERRLHRRLRVAILPLQGIDFSRVLHGDERADRRTVEEFERKAKTRMRQFDVTPTFPDFYSQVPQLLREVQVCLDQCLAGLPYEYSAARYGERLARWWQTWFQGRTGSLTACQARDHELLRDALTRIRTTLEVDPDEVLKIELWLRWEAATARQLTLWASSTGTWPDFDSMRRTDIRADSHYASVRAFCLGRPEIYSTEYGSDRWRTYLCVPLRIHNGIGDLLVGVISLASMRQLDGAETDDQVSISEIAPRNGMKVDEVIAFLREVGMKLVAPAPGA
ncbi:MAG TPA: SIR2 family protein [Pseudonocardiaceae bacterium]|nr:SIR2 family protein [Pseudonocardiaceae bacterium]